MEQPHTLTPIAKLTTAPAGLRLDLFQSDLLIVVKPNKTAATASEWEGSAELQKSPSIAFLKPSLIENGEKIVLRGLIEVFQCFAPVHGYKNKPNILNCIDGNLHYGLQSFQQKIYHSSKSHISSF